MQSLETLGKLRDVSGNVRSVLDKLKGIKADLVRGREDWQNWDFPQLVKALKTWKDINPVENNTEKYPTRLRDKGFQTKDSTNSSPSQRACVYCDAVDHKSANCHNIVAVTDRRHHLSAKQLCFNCTGSKHRASECRSRSKCQVCQRKHHTSICDRLRDDRQSGARSSDQLMTAVGVGKKAVTYPIITVEINGVMCRALLDTGAGSSYVSSTLIDKLKLHPIRREFKRIEMMFGSANKAVNIYGLSIHDLQGNFRLDAEVTRVDKSELLTVENPNYAEMVTQFSHLKGVTLNDTDKKPLLPVHLILGTNEVARIKTGTKPRIGREGEPIAELTRFGWTILSPGKDVDLTEMFLTQTATVDYEELCKLDVLGLEDSLTGNQETVYEEFKEQLTRSPEGWYETSLPWKGNHPPLSNNREGSLKRLNSLVRKLENQGQLETYDSIIRDQVSQGIVEYAHDKVESREFYIPHKAVIRENVESTKMRIVYDASAKANNCAPSLNECLETGPPLQNQLWSVLVRNRFCPVAIAGDLKQAFLQIRIREGDRDAVRFHWLKDLTTKQMGVFRFTRVLFGLAPSPFLLAAVIKEHLQKCRAANPTVVEEIERSLYVDDLIGGGETVKEALELKETAKSIFKEATFELHKWHSSVPALEVETPLPREEQSYAKQQLGVKEGESKLLGIPWEKKRDLIQVNFAAPTAQATKRGILGKVARIYDPLGLASPVTLSGKVLYRDACDSRIAWDAPLPRDLRDKWSKWEKNLPVQVNAPRSLAQYHEKILSIDLHGFGDASAKGVSAAVYAVVKQPSGTSKGLVTAKSRLAKKGLTTPRLELVSGHMVANLVHNVKETLQGFPVQSTHCWLDSTVALHWIRGNGEYKQFVGNRVAKIQEKQYIKWRHVGTAENPADLGSRGGSADKLTALWWQGPDWLSEPENWPSDILTTPSKESEAEVKTARELLAVAVENKQDAFDELLQQHELWRVFRVGAWITRFLQNTRAKRQNRVIGPLTTEEIQRQRTFWTKRAQEQGKSSAKFEEDRLQLNIQNDQDDVLVCKGRIQGHYPIYLPDSAPYTRKLVQRSHVDTLHGGVGLTMTKIREQHWVPRLRKLVKEVIKSCAGCKRFQAIALATPPPGPLPTDRTEGNTPFEVIGVDFAGPLKYRRKSKIAGKAYLALFSCSLTRGLYLEVIENLETGEFLRSLKRLIAHRGRPARIYSDNGKTFVGAAKWLKQVTSDEKVQDYLAHQDIRWQFNLSRAPWWGGQFERLIALVKSSLYKTIGNGMLSWTELCEVVLDVEIALNNRPLSYVEDDIQLPTLTPASLLFLRPNQLPELEPFHLKDVELRRRAKYLRKCKQALWKRWTTEYLRGLRERHRLKQKAESQRHQLTRGDVVIIKDEERNRNKWKLGIVEDLITGRDGIVRAAKLRAGKTILERAVQQLYPLELSCDRETVVTQVQLNPNAPTFRPRRDAAVAARYRIQEVQSAETS